MLYNIVLIHPVTHADGGDFNLGPDFQVSKQHWIQNSSHPVPEMKSIMCIKRENHFIRWINSALHKGRNDCLSDLAPALRSTFQFISFLPGVFTLCVRLPSCDHCPFVLHLWLPAFPYVFLACVWFLDCFFDRAIAWISGNVFADRRPLPRFCSPALLPSCTSELKSFTLLAATEPWFWVKFDFTSEKKN